MERKLADTGLVCWGSGEFGQHGRGEKTVVDYISRGVELFDRTGVRLVACGASHTIIVTGSNALYGWGNDHSGQLGMGHGETVWYPARVYLPCSTSTPSDVTTQAVIAVSCGARHSAVVVSSGDVYVCGSNDHGQLGLPLNGLKSQMRLKMVDDLSESVRAVSCGDRHTLFLLFAGSLKLAGKLSPMTTATKGLVLQSIALQHNIISIASGSNHCLALTDTGCVYSIGLQNDNGKDIATQIMGQHSGSFTQIAAGRTHSAVLTESREVYTCGRGDYGQLGHGPLVTKVDVPSLVEQEGLMKNVTQVSCGENYTAVITEQGLLYMWGKQSYVITELNTISHCCPSSIPGEPLSMASQNLTTHVPPDIVTSDHVWHPTCVNQGQLRVMSIHCGAWHAAAVVSTTNMQTESLYISPSTGVSFNNGSVSVSRQDLLSPETRHSSDEVKSPRSTSTYGCNTAITNPKEDSVSTRTDVPSRDSQRQKSYSYNLLMDVGNANRINLKGDAPANSTRQKWCKNKRSVSTINIQSDTTHVPTVTQQREARYVTLVTHQGETNQSVINRKLSPKCIDNRTSNHSFKINNFGCATKETRSVEECGMYEPRNHQWFGVTPTREKTISNYKEFTFVNVDTLVYNKMKPEILRRERTRLGKTETRCIPNVQQCADWALTGRRKPDRCKFTHHLASSQSGLIQKTPYTNQNNNTKERYAKPLLIRNNTFAKTYISGASINRSETELYEDHKLNGSKLSIDSPGRWNRIRRDNKMLLTSLSDNLTFRDGCVLKEKGDVQNANKHDHAELVPVLSSSNLTFGVNVLYEPTRVHYKRKLKIRRGIDRNLTKHGSFVDFKHLTSTNIDQLPANRLSLDVTPLFRQH